MTLLEMGGTGDQGCLAGRPDGLAPCGAVVEALEVVAEGFDVVAAVFVRGVADGLAVRSEDWEDDTEDATGDSDRTGEGGGAGDREGCAGIPIAGASACTPIRLLPMATARIAPTTETGQPKPRNRRPRTPDWSTNTGAGANSSKLDSNMSGCSWRADPRSMEMPTGRTLRGLSLQGT
ncbi:hypothetical protein K7B10_36995 [Streptomyces flavotricini]|uniref:Uncharacterized protein n=1 Tax=Streptomyces flavotricini TaxID=66888 RepID=A0ABS8EIH8_9ACTN|nr:hypothetical protein [Streptomyces flavotricini]MCC0100282.1 hypothetical protein [Streptomyces flavotricini]